MKYLKAAAICALVTGLSVVLVLFIATKIWGNVPDEDLRGHTPKSLLTLYLDECKSGNIDKALSLWTPESLERFPDIREWCHEFSKMELEYGDARNGKYDTIYYIIAEGSKNGEKIRRTFYFEIRDANWHLHWHPTKIEQGGADQPATASDSKSPDN